MVNFKYLVLDTHIQPRHTTESSPFTCRDVENVSFVKILLLLGDKPTTLHTETYILTTWLRWEDYL